MTGLRTFLCVATMLGSTAADAQQEMGKRHKIFIEEFQFLYNEVASAQDGAIRCLNSSLAEAFGTRLDDIASRAGIDIDRVHLLLQDEHSRIEHLATLPCDPDQAKKTFDTVQKDFSYFDSLIMKGDF